MKRIVTVIAVLLLTLVGCKKPAGPKTTETADLSAPARPVNRLMPVSLPTETSTDAEPVATDRTTETPAPARTYTIRKGDTLWSLAKKFYGDGKRWKEIADANNITSESKLPIGKVLRIP